MTVKRIQLKDVKLAAVAAGIDSNLQRLRDVAVCDVEAQLELELDTPAIQTVRAEPAELVLRSARLNVETHGWSGSLSVDACRVHLDRGSVSIGLGMSATIATYIDIGA